MIHLRQGFGGRGKIVNWVKPGQSPSGRAMGIKPRTRTKKPSVKVNQTGAKRFLDKIALDYGTYETRIGEKTVDDSW